MARLKRSDPLGPGIQRARRGKGFSYHDEDGGRVTELEVLERVRELAIPPAWQDVWICPYPMGHLQATGIDAAGRKQYLYHLKWRERRDQQKFDSMLEFARSLPGMRKAIDGELARDGMDRERVLACAVRLLDRGFFRVGGESYAAENETYGLATMHKKHVALEEDNVIAFDYRAKSGKRRVQSLVDPEIYDIVAALKRRRGGLPELLAYKRGRRWVDVRSADINDFVKEVTGGDFTAKDFRTWNATLLAAVALSVSGPAHASVTQRKRAMARAVKEVSGYLGNTPAVARASYIDPRIFDRYETGQIISGALEDIGGEGGLGALHGPPEEAVLDLLTAERSEAVEKVTEAFRGTPVAV